MTKVKELNMKKQSYAGSQEAAEKLVEEAKQDRYLVSWKISEKHNKYGQYFLIDLAYSYNTPKDIMEEEPEPKEDPHEGVEYTMDLASGNVSSFNDRKKAEKEAAAVEESGKKEEVKFSETNKDEFGDEDDLEPVADDDVPFL
ncbi:hypothetical protein M3689_01015 [Alkalihalophilus marmarensis]|jgi:hypothetical protein|uniref:hypothetical protein n=1 Tax=Alkalihalophilus marmarensis TaxID=521377 RepID=UPI00203C5CEB|nr:hypothetical protein [Alkalihalophilus marmarensis]MCM3487880.1 hypothetical protein [Alkalihalophilus marmarensis]